MYIEKLKPYLVEFLKKQYRNAVIDVKHAEISGLDGEKVDIVFSATQKGKSKTLLAEFSDYKCVIVDINTAFVENVYAKAWAEYVVSVLNSNKDLSLSVDGYKKAYNSYCEREYAKALLRAEEELNKNSL